MPIPPSPRGEVISYGPMRVFLEKPTLIVHFLFTGLMQIGEGTYQTISPFRPCSPVDFWHREMLDHDRHPLFGAALREHRLYEAPIPSAPTGEMGPSHRRRHEPTRTADHPKIRS